MLYHFNGKSVFLLIFFLHALIFAVLLFIRSYRSGHYADRWLGLFLLLAALYIAPFMLGYAGWYAGGSSREALFYLPLQQLFLIPPAFYFYIRSILNPDFRVRRKEWLHLLPALTYLLYTAALYVADRYIFSENYFYHDGRDKDFDPWYQVLGLMWMLGYLLLSLRHYIRYSRYIFSSLSYADSIAYSWARFFILAFLSFIFLRLLFFAINPEWGEFGRKFWYYLSFGALTYGLSIAGLIHSVKISVPLQYLPTPIPVPQPVDAAPEQAVQPEDDPVEVSIEQAADIEVWKEKIAGLMESEALFENPELTVADLAAKLDLPPKKLSQWINLGFGMNFNDFVNGYRVRAVMDKLSRGQHDLHTIFSLALDAGFNSKSTFNRVFKKQTGLTPKEWALKYGRN